MESAVCNLCSDHRKFISAPFDALFVRLCVCTCKDIRPLKMTKGSESDMPKTTTLSRFFAISQMDTLTLVFVQWHSIQAPATSSLMHLQRLYHACQYAYVLTGTPLSVFDDFARQTVKKYSHFAAHKSILSVANTSSQGFIWAKSIECRKCRKWKNKTFLQFPHSDRALTVKCTQ